MNLLLIGGILVAVSLGATLVAVYLFRSVRKQYQAREKELALHFIQIRDTIHKHQQRILTLSSHASGYVNSLGGDTSKALLYLQQLVKGPEQLLQEAESILTSQDLAKQDDLEIILGALEVCVISPADQDRLQELLESEEVRELVTAQGIPVDWQSQVEDLSQKVGREIYRASKAMEHLRSPESRKRKETVIGLKAIGIENIKVDDD